MFPLSSTWRVTLKNPSAGPSTRLAPRCMKVSIITLAEAWFGSLKSANWLSAEERKSSS